ncbi:MauE/DoxX family redox-associated membrane protein [Micromonospora sp. NPDC048999]|uniref:MauE/DoxX family redox-associated membrane protein n=1 Tax=Micromonospora sp. NPDC048999 TaxID=3155391 RepID=UPI003405AE33
MQTAVLDATRLAIAVTLLFAGASKLLSPYPLAHGIRSAFNWTRAHLRASSYLARGIAVVEITASLLVASAWLLPIGLVSVGAVGAGVIVFTLVSMSRGARVSCGCFGESSGKPAGVPNLLAGVAFVGVAALLLVLDRGAGADPALLLALTAILAVAAAMVRHRAELLRPYARHFKSFAK